MIKNHSVIICLIISLAFMIAATSLYPGGSLLNKDSVGFDWSENFFSNLFAVKAINGLHNPSVIWALIGIAMHSFAYGLFFINMSKKLHQRQASNILKLIGVANILFTFLIATSLHDLMVAISSTLFLIGMFYITYYIFKTKLHFLKFACVISMLIFYYTLFLYGSGNWGLLAIMQKVSFICSMLLVLGLEYFSKSENFKQIAPS